MSAAVRVDPDALVAFIDELRDAGFNIGASHYIAAHDLILAVTARGESFPDPVRLRRLLAPLLCSSAKEQSTFTTHFDRWSNRLLRRRDASPPPPPPQPSPVVEASLSERLGQLAKRTRTRFVIGAGVAAISALVWFGLYINTGRDDQGSVQINSTPPGAVVWLIDRSANNMKLADSAAITDLALADSAFAPADSIGTTPFLWTRATGRYRIIASAPGHIDIDTIVDVVADSTSQLELSLAEIPMGVLHTVVELPGRVLLARLLDGPMRPVPSTIARPGEYRVIEAGRYIATVDEWGYSPREDTIDVTAGDTTVYAPVLRPLPNGTLILNAPPATIASINNRDFDLPADPIRVNAGATNIFITQPGYEDLSLQVDIRAGSTVTIDTVLTRLPTATVRLESQPAGALITLDPVAYTETPDRQATAPAHMSDVTVGTYHVIAELPGYESFADTLTVVAGDQSRTILLRPARRSLFRVAFAADGAITLPPSTAVPAGGAVLVTDSMRMAIADERGRIIIRNAAADSGAAGTRTRIRTDTLYGHDVRATSMAFSTDGRLAASGDASGLIRLRSLQPRRLGTLPALMGVAVAFSPDGRLLAAGIGRTNGLERVEIVCFDTRTLQPVRAFPAGDISQIAFQTDGRLTILSVDTSVVVGDSANGLVHVSVVDPESGDTIGVPFTLRKAPNLELSRGGRHVVWSNASGDSVFLHAIESGGTRELARMRTTSRVAALAVSADGQRIIIATVAGPRLVDLATSTDTTYAAGQARDVEFSPDGNLLAHTDETGSLLLYRIRNEGPLVESAHINPSTSTVEHGFVFSADSRRLAVINANATVEFLEIGAPTLTASIDSLTAVVQARGSSAAFSADGVVAFFGIRPGAQTAELQVWAHGGNGFPLALHGAEIRSLAFTPDGNRLASSAADSTVLLWDVAQRAVIDTLRLARGAEAVTFNRDGSRLATTTPDSAVIIWNTAGSRLATAWSWLRRAGWLLLLAFGSAAIPFVWRRLAWRRDVQPFLVRRQADEPPELERIALRSATGSLFADLNVLQVARRLRRRVDAESAELDVNASVLMTTRQGGVFTPSFARRQVMPEYLALIDRTTYGDQQALFVDELLDRLAQDHVFITRYYFDGDPRICFPRSERERPLSLQHLQQRYPRHRLLLFADTHNLFSPLTGERELWLEQLLHWDDRSLLTPEPPAHWGPHAAQLGDFVLGSANPRGLAAATERLTIEHDRAAAHAPGATLPANLWQRASRWVERDPPPARQIDEVIRDTRSYLGADGMFWLAACAVYPAINWKLTLNLGYMLMDGAGRRLLDTDRLLALSRLPWFRYAHIPDWLRLRLLDELSPEQERQVRTALEALLLTAAEGNSDVHDLQIATRQGKRTLHALTRPLLRVLARGAPRRHALNDFVFLSFMEGRTPERLAVRLPRTIDALLRGRRARSSLPARLAADVKRLQSALVESVSVAILLAVAVPAAWQRVPESVVSARLIEQIDGATLLSRASAGGALEDVSSVIAPGGSMRTFPAFAWIAGLTLALALVTYLVVRRVDSNSLQPGAASTANASGAGATATAFRSAASRRRELRASAARRRRLRRRVAITAAVAAALSITAATYAYITGQRFAGESRALIAAADTGPLLTALPSLDQLRALDDLGTRLFQVGWFEQNNWPLGLRFGFRRDALLAELRSGYFRAFDTLLGERTRVALEAVLQARDSIAAEPSPRPSETYRALRAYLMLTDHAAQAEPAFLAPALADFWSAHEGASADLRSLALAQFETLARELANGNPLAQPADASLVQGAREYLAKVSSPEWLYMAVIDELMRRGNAIEWPSSAILQNSVNVPAPFTADGAAALERVLNEQTTSGAENWVLGEVIPLDTVALRRELRLRYISDYRGHWTNFLGSFRIGRLSAADRSLASLRTEFARLEVLLREHLTTALPAPDAAYLNGIAALESALEQVAANPATDPRAEIAAAQGIIMVLNASLNQRRASFVPDSAGFIDARLWNAAIDLLNQPLQLMRSVTDELMRRSVSAAERLNERVLVPDVRALGLADATAVLSRANLRIVTTNARSLDPRVVIAQDPAPGSVVLFGSAVSVTLGERR